MKRILIISLLALQIVSPVLAQKKQDDMKREVTIYNPYKPSLTDTRKRSFLPEITDTSKTRPDFTYTINTRAYTPEYLISPIKAAVLQPDPLPKLYKSYLKIGLGNYFSPLAEFSTANERSKKGAIGFNARHFSTNGKVKLDNDEKVFAGYMDNDASLFGKKFFRNSVLEGSVDYKEKSRYAYGYDTSLVGLSISKKEIGINYNDIGANLSLSSLTLDSSNFSYDFDVHYDLFGNTRKRYQHNAGITGSMATMYKDFYAGSGMKFEYFRTSKYIYNKGKYVFELTPFLKKSTQQWNFRAGVDLVLEKDTSASAKFHLYPDVTFGFSIIPSYVSFFAGLNGRLEINDPAYVIGENPFLLPWGPLYELQNTSHSLIVSAGLKGNTGIGGNYLLSATYSLINNMLFYTNYMDPYYLTPPMNANFFIPQYDDVDLLKVHGEMTGKITDKISFIGNANWYGYTLTDLKYAWNKPSWDAMLGIKYNLRDKISAGLDLDLIGKRKLAATYHDIWEPDVSKQQYVYYSPEYPVHLNINLSAEYKYSKILSFWLKVNNIAFDRYYEWAFYPTQRFLCLVGFTYSL